MRKGLPDVAVYDRVQLLDYEQVKAFWRFRGPNVAPLGDLSSDQIARGDRPDLGACASAGSVLYVLDELHEHLNSRQWKNTGPAVLHYIAKHRHLGDDVLWLTQSVPNVDKQWRSVTQEYIYCRNFRKERWKGFSRGSGFRVESYLEPYTGTQQIQWSQEYKLDKEVAACYSTSTVGGAADQGEAVKGRSLWWLWGTLGGLFLLASVASIWGPSWLLGAADAAHKQSVPQVSSVINTPSVVPAQSTPASSLAEIVVAVPVSSVSAEEVVSRMADKLPSLKAMVSPDGCGVVLVGNDEAVRNGSFVVRSLDRERPMVAVSAVILRDVAGRSASYGLAEIIAQAQEGNGALSEAVNGVSINLDGALLGAGVDGGVLTLGSAAAARLFLDAVSSQRVADDALQVVARPSLTVVSGDSAKLSSGREIPVPVTVAQAQSTTTSVEYKQAELSFDVLPVVEGNLIRVVLNQSNSEVLSQVQVGGNSVPVLSRQSLQTRVTVKAGQVLCLGGVAQETQGATRTGVPVLRDIPLVGFIFGGKTSETRRESVWVLLTFEALGPNGAQSVTGYKTAHK